MRTGVHVRMPGENLKGPIVGDFQSIAELREHLYQRCQNRCKTRAHAKELVLHVPLAAASPAFALRARVRAWPRR